MNRPDYEFDIEDRLVDKPTLEELRHVVPFLPEIYQDYIDYLTRNEDKTDGDCITVCPRIDGTTG